MYVSLGPSIEAWVRAESVRREVSISEVIRTLILAEIARTRVKVASTD